MQRLKEKARKSDNFKIVLFFFKHKYEELNSA